MIWRPQTISCSCREARAEAAIRDASAFPCKRLVPDARADGCARISLVHARLRVLDVANPLSIPNRVGAYGQSGFGIAPDWIACASFDDEFCSARRVLFLDAATFLKQQATFRNTLFESKSAGNTLDVDDYSRRTHSHGRFQRSRLAVGFPAKPRMHCVVAKCSATLEHGFVSMDSRIIGLELSNL